MESILTDKLSKVLFHGTLMDRAENIINNGIDFGKLNPRADFGKGFYTTDSYALAENTAILRYNDEKQKYGASSIPVVLRLKISIRDYITPILIKEFYGETLEWKRFVCTNRWYNKVSLSHPEYDHNYNGEYGIVIGLTADGKMKRITSAIKDDNYNLSNEFLKNVSPFQTYYMKTVNNKTQKVWTKAYQISFHDENFLKSCIIYKNYDIILLEKED